MWLRLAGGLIGHRSRSEFSFRYDNKDYVFCARCSGLYTTALPGIILFTFLSSMDILYGEQLTVFVGIMAIPAIIDLILLNYSSKWRESHYSKKTIAFLTGLLFGISLSLFGPLQVEMTSKVFLIVIVFAGLVLLYKTHLWIPYGGDKSNKESEI